MKRNQELADFEVDPATGKARIIDMPKTGDGPLAFAEQTQQSGDQTLTDILRARSISTRRPDMDDILASFGALSTVHLALMGHGLSLSDQYWYRAPGSTERWEDINFFDNEWDPGFGAAVLRRDYTRLATCSPDVPDTATSGKLVKTWERNEDGIFLIKESTLPDGIDLQGVVLAADLCAALFGEGRYIPVSIVARCGKLCSANPLMLASDEEFADGSRLCAMTGIQEKQAPHQNSVLQHELCQTRIKAYTAIGIPDASAHVARMASLSCLTMLSNLHHKNFGVIRKVGSDTWRPAPIFDYDGSFGFLSAGKGIQYLCTDPSSTALLCARRFSYLDSTWDWSWYNPYALEGFEERIMEAFAPCQSLPPDFARLTALIFAMQRKYVDSVATAKPGDDTWAWKEGEL